ncbi:MAG: hypothetical protein P8Y17_02160 [Patescibacteria group bacterium]
MKVKLIPKSKLGKLSVGLIIAMPILYSIGMSFTDSLYKSVPAGKTILKDIMERPALALTMLSGMITGVSAFFVGLVAITRERERAVLVYVATLIGMLHILFLIGEVVFPH